MQAVPRRFEVFWSMALMGVVGCHGVYLICCGISSRHGNKEFLCYGVAVGFLPREHNGRTASDK